MNYPDYKSLPPWGKTKYNTALSLVYENFAVKWWLDQTINNSTKFSINQTAAICGNTRQESVYNPVIQGDPHIPGYSNGLQQWNNKRNADMMKYVSSMFGDAEYYQLTDQEKFWGQLHFTHYEIHSPGYKRALQCLITNENDPGLAGKFGEVYEGFSDKSDEKRNNNALAIIASYKAGLYTMPDQKVTVQPPKPSKKQRKRSLQQSEKLAASSPVKAPIILPALKWCASPNFSERTGKVDLIVIHDCEGSYDSSVSWFTNPNSQVSAHYVLKEDGSEATQMVDLDKKAWHVCNLNSRSIGIEMGGTIAKGFSQEQIQASANMAAFLLHKYNLPPTFAKGGVGSGYCSHHSLGKAGGGHSDPTSNDDEFHTKWGLLIEKAYNEYQFPSDWVVNKKITNVAVDHSVKWAQITLNKLGKYGVLTVDGNLGPKTQAAIQSFEKDKKLKITGKLGFETIDALAAIVINSPKFKSRRG